MASLQWKHDRAIVQFTLHGNRRTLRLGNVGKAAAKRLAFHVEQVVAEIHADGRPSVESMDWMRSCGPSMRTRLEKCGLLPVRRVLTIARLCERFKQHGERKHSTDQFYGHTMRNLIQHFGDVDAATVTPATAADFRAWLNGQGYAEATVNRRIKAARSIFALAVRHKLIDENPFADVKAGGQQNPRRLAYVSADTVDRLIAAADRQLASALVLARFAGLRFPSEVMGGVEDHGDRLIVRSPKTEHHVGKASRVVPLYWQLRVRRWALTFDWSDVSGQAITHRLMRRLDNCDIKPWPRIWQNLRASCETDLVRQGFPPHEIAKWMGHSLAMSERHYHMMTDDALQKATQPPSDMRGQVTPPVVAGGATSATAGGYRGGAMGVEGLNSPNKSRKKVGRAAISDALFSRRRRTLARLAQRKGL